MNQQSTLRICYISTFPPARCGIAYYTVALAKNIKKENPCAKIYILPLTDEKNKIIGRHRTFFSTMLNVSSLLNPDVIHIQHHFSLYSSFSLILFSLLSKFLMKKYRIVITLHELPSISKELQTIGLKRALTPLKIFNGLRVMLLLRGLFLFDKVIVHTYYAKKLLIYEYHLPYKKVVVLPHGSESPVQIFPPLIAKKRLAIDPRKKVILCFGFIQPYKGYEYLLEAVSKVPKIVRENILILIAGDAHPNNIENGYKYLKTLQKTVERLGLGNNVRFDTKFIPEKEVPLYFSSADLVVLSHTESLASGVFHLAVAYGKPIIASDVGEFKEFLKLGIGVLVPPRNVIELRNAIVQMLFKSEAELAYIRSKLKEVSEKYFSWKVIAKKTLLVYDELLKHKRSEPL